MDIIAITGLAVGIIGVAYAAMTYKKGHIESPIEGRNLLLVQFNANRTLTQQVIELLREYTSINNALDAFMFPNITYRTYISELEAGLSTGNLSPGHITFLQSGSLSSQNINSMIRSLQTQHQALLEIHAQTRLLLKS